MTNEELVCLYQQDDKKALEELIEQNKGMVYKLANKYYTGKTNAIDLEDLHQEGVLGIMIAAEKYDINHNKKALFIVYAVHWINSKINRFIHNNCTNDESSLNVIIGQDGDRQRERVDYLEDIDYGFENVEERIYQNQLRADLERVMNKSTSLSEREVLKLHYGWYGNGYMTTEEVGEVLSMPGAKIRNYESKAIRKLRNSNWARTVFKKYYSADGISHGSMFKIRKDIRAGRLMDWYL